MNNLAEIPVADFADGATVRLVSTAYIVEPALSPLADDASALTLLERLEMMTSARHAAAVPLPLGVDAKELLNANSGYGWTYVNAAFCYTRTGGNRFNSAKRGAWYASYGDNGIDTSKAEVAYHLGRELANVGVYENTTCYGELLAGFSTRLHDLNGQESAQYLQPDTKSAYPAGQTLAEQILLAGGNGVLYPSSRTENGQCLAAFRPNLVQNIRRGEVWKFEWNGKPEPEISKMEF